jgi:hypothetical protein
LAAISGFDGQISLGSLSVELAHLVKPTGQLSISDPAERLACVGRRDGLKFQTRLFGNPDVAFGHSLNRISGTLKSGNRTDFWLRWTACFRKIDGNWLIVHHQASVPVDFESGRALLNLEP